MIDIEYDTNGGCWLWAGKGLATRGYARVWRNGANHWAHRLSWLTHRGEIPPGLHVLHKCDVPSCVNPDHLFLGTHTDNMRDMARKGRAGSLYGERVGTAKLSNSDVVEIRSLYASRRWTQTAIAARYGVTQANISLIVRGDSRKRA